MAKRFTDTNKYKKPFIRSLKGAYKLLWDYLYHDCDHAGIWIVDFDIAQIYIGPDMPINKIDALKYFNDSEIRIIEIENKSKWYIPSFIDFQYGELSENNRAHNSVIQILKKYNLYKNKGHIRSLQGAMDKDKDKDMVKDKDKDKYPFVNPEFKASFLEWIEYKNERKECYKTSKSIEAVYNKLIKLANNKPGIAQAIIKQSIENNWAGLFEFKGKIESIRTELNTSDYNIPKDDYFGIEQKELIEMCKQGKYKLK